MVSEEKYHKLVRQWLYESFADVDHEVVLESRRRPDFIAYTPFGGYVIEVENTFDSQDLYDGLGQVMTYGMETGLTPVVVFPADEVEEPEFSNLSDYTEGIFLETV